MVYAEVAALAGGYHVLGYLAGWVTGAQVGGGEAYEAAGPACFVVVTFGASAGARVRRVESALAGALALLAGAYEADGVGKFSPAGSVA